MSVTTGNYHFGSTGWCSRTASMMLMTGQTEPGLNQTSPNVDDGLTSLSWLQNLNMCRLGAPTPPTPPASPVCSSNCSINALTANTNKLMNNKNLMSAKVDAIHNSNGNKIQSIFQSHKEGRNHSNGSSNSSKKSQQTNENEVVDYKTNGSVKPPFSYATLICMAMKANKNKMTLSAIYKWIRENFLYYKNADPSWQNSIRHNLSLNKCFIKIPRNKDEPGKGGFWRLDPVYADTLVDGVFKKRRPSQRGSGGNNGQPFRKKSRRKENVRNDGSQTTALTNTKGLATNETDTHLIHDTPPNSTESYALYGEAANDVVELVTAVNSIEGVGTGSQCATYSYTIQGPQSEQLLQPGYGNEICITESVPEDCILEAEDGEICWNAILTDADLNELTNFASPVIQTTDASITISDSTTTTAQLTAVEPHSLHLVANATPTNCVVGADDSGQAFHNRNINCLTIRPNMGSDVIAATHNVVTCVNPTIVNTSEWNQWHTFSTVANHESQGTDLMVRQINGHCEPMVTTSPSVIYTTAPANSVCGRPNPSLKHSGAGNQTVNSTSGTSTQPSSPTATTFEHNIPLQPWAECKAALEAAALDLESFATLDVVHHY